MKHPAAQDALRYIKSRPEDVILGWLEAFNEEGVEISTRCFFTLSYIRQGVEVDDIDILGLAYVMKQGECG